MSLLNHVFGVLACSRVWRARAFGSFILWNLLTVGGLQFGNDNAVASLEVNQNRPKILRK